MQQPGLPAGAIDGGEVDNADGVGDVENRRARFPVAQDGFKRVITAGKSGEFDDDAAVFKRDRLLGILTKAGFGCFKPSGAYYIMTDISGFGFADDVSFARYLVEKIGVAVVPGSSFYDNPAMGAKQVRFTFCKKESTLAAAAAKLANVRPR